MVLTLVSKSFIIDNVSTTDVQIAAALNAVSVTTLYSISVVPISNSQAKIIMIYA